MNKQEFITLDIREQNAGGDGDDLGLSLPAAKNFDEFEERLEQLQKLYVREVRRFRDNLNYPILEKR